MYLIKYLTKTCNRNMAALAAPKEVFELLWILDNSEHVVAWQPIDFHPTDFGWSGTWKKLRTSFTSEDYEKVG